MKVHRFADEVGVYKLLGLPYIEPELRQGRGELEAADSGELPDLVTLDQFARRSALPHDPLGRSQQPRGDGPGGAQARLRLLRDHRPLGQPRLRRPCRRQVAGEADQGGAASGTSQRRRASGCWRAPRSTSAPRASSTTPDELLAEARLGRRERPHLVQHLREGDDRTGGGGDRASPGGLHRPPDRSPAAAPRALRSTSSGSAEAAAANGTMLEINGNPNRRDLNERHARVAPEAGVMIVCNTDAHGVDTLDQHGLLGRDRAPGLAEREQVANTAPWRSFAPRCGSAQSTAALARGGGGWPAPVPAQARGADEADRLEGRAGLDVEADPVALLDRVDGALAAAPAPAPRPARTRCRPPPRRGKIPTAPATSANAPSGHSRARATRPGPVGGQRRRHSGPGQQRAHRRRRRARPGPGRARRQRARPPGGGDDQGGGIGVAVGGDHVTARRARSPLPPASSTVIRSRSQNCGALLRQRSQHLDEALRPVDGQVRARRHLGGRLVGCDGDADDGREHTVLVQRRSAGKASTSVRSSPA